MKAVVFHGIGDIRLESVREPKIEDANDALVTLTASAICGTDLHMVRGTLGPMRPGTILGHEGVGIVEEVGKGVRNFEEGDRVVIPSTIACGACQFCRGGLYSQCDVANPNGKQAGTAFFGGPTESGPFQGLQAEMACIPFANAGLVRVPPEVTDDQAILISDIFPTGYFGAKLADIRAGDTVAVFGCGPVGQFSIASARLLGAGRIFAIDRVPSRLAMARRQQAETINFDKEDPAEVLRELTNGDGVDCAIDAVGVDAYCADHGPARRHAKSLQLHFEQEVSEIFAQTGTPDKKWHAGNAPSQALRWALQGLRKAGRLAIIGVYPSGDIFFPLGEAMNHNLTVKMGNCNHRKYIPKLLELVRTGAIDPAQILTNREPMASALDAYKAFEEHQPGWMKVKLDLAA